MNVSVSSRNENIVFLLYNFLCPCKRKIFGPFAFLPSLVYIYLNHKSMTEQEKRSMKRILLTVAYDGTDFCGWQTQPGKRTVEGELNKALTEMTGKEIAVIGASRTDSGVHGKGNLACFDYDGPVPADRFYLALNTYLPDDIRVRASEEVKADFHPRHCNSKKTYEYTYYCDAVPMPTERRFAAYTFVKPDIEAMNRAAAYLVGEHDFKSFCCVRTQAESTVRRIISIDVFARDENHVVIRVTGNGFLYNMVRIIAGTLLEVGAGRYEPEIVREMLNATDRCAAGKTAPPEGLTLVRIEIPPEEKYL